MLSEIESLLRAKRIAIEPGLNGEESRRIESVYDIQLPPDLKKLITNFLPVGSRFVNWRDFSAENIQDIKERLNQPLEDILSPIEDKNFPEFKNERLDEALSAARNNVADIPKLIPIFAHRYIPAYPSRTGNPIFSVYQKDIIYYGSNLLDYFRIEFGDKDQNEINFENIRPIPYWSDICGV